MDDTAGGAGQLHVLNDRLINEKVIRLENGFPTTKREKDAFEQRQERNMKILAEQMGLTIPNRKKEGAKVCGGRAGGATPEAGWPCPSTERLPCGGCGGCAVGAQRPLHLWLRTQVQEVLRRWGHGPQRLTRVLPARWPGLESK
jgi:hypothetical protein